MFGLKVSAGSDVTVEVKLTLARGAPFVAWDGPPDASDADVTGDMLANRNVVAYLWAAADRGKLKVDELGFTHVPARVVAMQGTDIISDDRVTIGLTLPPKSGDAQMSSYQLQRELLAMLSSAMSAMQKSASEAIAQVSTAGVNAIKEMSAAHSQQMQRSQDALDHVAAHTSTALKDLGTAHQKTLEKAHEALTTVAASADKLTGLADKIFEDSRERAAALVHEARKGAAAAKPESPMSEQVKDIRAMTDLMMMVKSVTEDKSDGGTKK